MTGFYLLPEFYYIFFLSGLVLFCIVYSTSLKLHYPLLIKSALLNSLYLFGLIFFMYMNTFSYNEFVSYMTLQVTSYTTLLKLVIVVLSFFLLLLTLSYIKYEKINSFEYVILVLLSILGLLFLLSTNNIIILFLSLELQSLSFYILCSYQRTKEASIEAGLKYFIFGSFASALLLFGVALLYGLTGITYFSDFAVVYSKIPNFDLLDIMSLRLGIDTFFSGFTTDNAIALLGLTLLIVGFLFKLYAVPFHVWVPDIYEGSPTSVTALFALLPATAIFGFFVKVLYVSFLPFIDHWSLILLITSTLSLILGAFAAIAQKRIKRLIAYSSIGHTGYLLLGLSSGSIEALNATFFYVISYSIMTLAFFSAYMSLRKQVTGVLVEYIADFRALLKQNPIIAAALAVAFFSMAGIPPLLGFFSKLYIFLSVAEQYRYFFLFLCITTSAVGAYYYLNVVRVMFFETKSQWVLFRKVPGELAFLLAISIFAIVLFVVHPSFFIALSYKLTFLLLL
uniref:NADH dehydrogenase subunit 2 n=1 Tax=Tsukubamonas globosa TaxID=875863 RepID=W8VTH0_9EUKA|nr:NADH dehydrogenase subunit 2 [Tsukubamonas globosa]BAO51978.1 NADH dehydrogenase subunit 2 [Tsukubamonas globosa]